MSPVADNFKIATVIRFGAMVLALLAPLAAADQADFDLTSDALAREHESEPVVYGETLETMRKAEKPRFVTLVDAFHYARGSALATRGVLFAYHNRAAREVRFVADIPGFAPQPMRRNKYGVWIFFYAPPKIVHASPTRKIRYKFWVDGLYTVDDSHEQQEQDTTGQTASVFHLLHDQFASASGIFILDTPVHFGREVLFRIPAGDAETVSLAGDFNHWNPQRDFLSKSEDGFFELRKVIGPGEYTFLFRVDGKLKQSVATPKSRMHPVYGRVNYLVIK